MFSKISTREYTGSLSAEISGLKAMLAEADAVIIGAGAGLSESAGMDYNGARFERYFGGFTEKYGISDMRIAYTGLMCFGAAHYDTVGTSFHYS